MHPPPAAPAPPPPLPVRVMGSRAPAPCRWPWLCFWVGLPAAAAAAAAPPRGYLWAGPPHGSSPPQPLLHVCLRWLPLHGPTDLWARGGGRLLIVPHIWGNPISPAPAIPGSASPAPWFDFQGPFGGALSPIAAPVEAGWADNFRRCAPSSTTKPLQTTSAATLRVACRREEEVGGFLTPPPSTNPPPAHGHHHSCPTSFPCPRSTRSPGPG